MAGTDIKLKLGVVTKGFNRSLKRLEGSLKRSLNRMERIGSNLSNSITLPVIAMGGAAIQSAVKLDQLKKGLTGIMGSAELAADEFNRLRKLAKDPGMSLQSVVEGSVKLQAIGYDAGKAAEQMKVLGNAIALVGGGGEALSGVTLAMTQILGKGKVHAEEINQMAERLPQIRKAMIDAFGTADTEVIQKMGLGAEEFIDGIIDKLAELPPAQKTLRDQFQHLSDDLMVLGASIGNMLIPYLFKVIGVVQKVISKWQSLSDTTKGWVTGILLSLAVGGPLLSGFARVSKAVLGIIGKFNLWKLAIAAVVTAGFIIYKNWDWIKDKINKAREAFANYKNSHALFNEGWEGLRAKLLGGVEALKLVGSVGANSVGALTNAVWELSKGNVSGAWDKISEGGANTIHAWNEMSKNLEHIEGMKQLRLLMGEDAPKGPSVIGGMLDDLKEKLKELGIEAKELVGTLFDGGGSGGGGGGSVTRSPFNVSGMDSATYVNQADGGVSGIDGSLGVSLGSLNKQHNLLTSLEAAAKRAGETMKKVPIQVAKGVDWATASFEELFAGLSTKTIEWKDLTLKNIATLAEGIKTYTDQIISIFTQLWENKEIRLDNYYEKQRKHIEKSSMSEEVKAKRILALDKEVEEERLKLARKKAKADKAAAIFQSIINGLVAVSGALGKPPLAILIGALAAANTAAIAAQPLPGFAKGGVFSGENAIRVGEYPNSRFNPEVVAPLDKLKGMMGNAMGKVQVQFQGAVSVTGQQIDFVLRNYQATRQRLTA